MANILLLAPSATISGTTTVCQNAPRPKITFTGSGGTAPYTFTYKIDSGGNIITSSGNNVTVDAPTTTTGTFIYTLISVKDSKDVSQDVNGTATIKVNAPPITDFTFTNDNTCSGTTIQFNPTVTGTSTYTYTWDFGDGNTSTAKNPTHIFNALGCGTATFNVKLTVTDGICTVVKTRTISVKQKPDINFEDTNNQFSPFDNCASAATNPVFTVSVGNASASKCILSFSINWGDGNTENNITFPIQHTYATVGAYNMVITALGNNGCENSKNYVVKNVSNPLGGLNSPGSTQNLCGPTSNLQFSISNWGSNSLDTSYSIYYGDGTPELILTQTQLNSSSYYNATTPANSVNYPIPHIYTKSSCPASSFEVKLVVTNACGPTPFTLGNITILTKPDANFNSPSVACVNKSVLFTNTTISGSGQNCQEGAIYKWDFGDGSPIVTTPVTTPQNISHTYTNYGTYTVTLTAQNFCGSTTKTQQICIEPPIATLFITSVTEGCGPLAVTATNTTVLTNQCAPSTYLWSVSYAADFCGNTMLTIPDQTTENASYNFTVPGTYTIKLTTTNSCGSTSISKTVIVKKPPTISAINGILPDYCGSASINPTATVNSCAPPNSILTYAWSFPGGTPATANTANPGVINYPESPTPYTVSLVVTNECGASTTATKIFSVKTAPAITNSNLSQSICSGLATTLVTLTANTPGTTFSWTATATAGITGFTTSGSDVITAQNITTTNASPGTVTYEITPKLGTCIGAKVNYIVTVNPSPSITTQPVSSTICLGGTPTPLSIVLSSSSITPTYQWFSNTTNSTSGGIAIIDAINATYNPTANAIGTTYYYCVISLSSGGCSSINSNIVSITINPLPTITAQPLATQSICTGGNVSALTMAYSGGSGSATYQWYSNTTNSTSGGTAVGLNSPSYTPPTFTNTGTFYHYATISLSGNGCGKITSDLSEVIVIADPIITTQPMTTQTLCEGGNTSTLLVAATGGLGNFTYQWYSNSPPATIISGATSDNYTPDGSILGLTNYYCIISQPNLGCEVKSNLAAVNIVAAPKIITQPKSSSVCEGKIPATLTVTYANGTGTPTYQWFSNAIDSNSGGNLLSEATTDTYIPQSVTIGTMYYYCEIKFSSGGCNLITSNTAEVIINQIPVIINQKIVACSGNPINLIPQDGNGNSVPSNTLFTWTVKNTNPVGSITGATSELTPQNGLNQTLINNTTNAATIVYTLTPIVSICKGNTFEVEVALYPKPEVLFDVPNQTICNNSTTSQVNISSALPGTISFAWTASIPAGISGATVTSGTNTIPPQTFVNSTNQPLIVTYTANGTFNYNGAGCAGPISLYQITVNPTIIASGITSNYNGFGVSYSGATDGSIDVTVEGGSGNYIYSWVGPNGFSALTQDLNGVVAGNYSVTINDSYCPRVILNFVLTQPPELLFEEDLSAHVNLLCFGYSNGAFGITITKESIPPYDFQVVNSSGTVVTAVTDSSNINQVFNGLSSDTYTVIITDANGGIKKRNGITITQPDEILIAVATTAMTCYGANNASITLTVSGGTAPYQAQWENFASGFYQNNLAAGLYTILVTDNNNCTKQITVDIPEAPMFKVNPVVTNISCFGAHDGSIVLNFVGGTPPVNLVWSDGSTSGTTRNNLGPGTYSVTIIDGTPCTIFRTFTILEPQPVVVSANLTNAFDCDNANSGAINLLVSGGTPPFNYLWSNGTTTEDLNSILAGNYLITVTDARNCIKTAQYKITRQEPINIQVLTQTDFNCETHTVSQSFLAKVSGGIPPYQINWSSGAVSGINNEIMQTDTNGAVLLKTTDSYGCIATQTLVVAMPELGYSSIESSSYAYSTYGYYSINDPIQFKGNVTGDYISVSWDFGDGTFSTEVNPIHTYINAKDHVVKQTVTYPFGGCVYINTITLMIEKGYVFVLPTGFTPNNDGINDTYRPIVKALKNVKLEVYDSWGALIYSEKGDVLKGWNGQIKNKNAENGNYYCKVSAETFYGTMLIESTPFTLIK